MAIIDIPSYETAALPGNIEGAHKAYHNLDSNPDASPEMIVGLGRVLCRSMEIDHMIDSGWAFMQAGAELKEEDLVAHSLSILHGVIRHTKGTPAEISARIPCVIGPEYLKVAHGESASSGAFAHRLHALNGRVLSLRSTDIKRSVGIAPEVASLYLLNRHFAENPDQYPDTIAWPAFPWQDNHLRNSQKNNNNYDFVVGKTPRDGIKVQVKNSLEPKAWKRADVQNDGDALLAKWRRQYKPDIALVFGDVHLGNTSSRPFAINQAIENIGNPRNHLAIALATKNLLDEIGLK
jgi:hypothetical protein